MLKHRGVWGRGATKEIGNVLTDLYGWVGSDGGWRRTKVGMVIADVGLGQSASRGKDKQSWRMYIGQTPIWAI